MQERLRAILDKIVQWWKKFNNKQRMLMISSVGVVIIALVILGLVMSKPKMVELVASDDAKQASEIKSLLSDNNITYQVGDDLVFYVDKDDEVNAIMLLGENNIPAESYDINNVTDGSFSTTEADKLKKYPGELSGGQQQRVAIARSIIAKPQIIFADEPTGNLDKKTGNETMKLLRDCARRFGQTLIVVTHDLDLAREADRIIHIEDGVVI